MMGKGLFAARVCAMLLFVLVYSVSHSYSAGAGDEQTKDAGLFHHGTLTEKEKRSIVTIEFNCTVIDTKNRTALNSIYRNVHKAILDVLNRRESKMTTIPPSTASVTTSDSTTAVLTTIPTTAKTTTLQLIVPNEQKRKKRMQKTSGAYDIDAQDLRFVEIDPEIDDNGILRMSLLLVVKGFDDRDCGEILLKAVNHTKENGTLDRVAGVPVVAIYTGLPGNRSTTSSQNYDPRYLIWPLVIVFVILLFVVIGCFIYYRKRNNKHTVEIAENQRKGLNSRDL